ncbi:glycine hydroxymethyltransferase [Nematocida sp. AWRm77]|nr:glycine hydroxymethyltransferase [Nematocida sp. AWRm77]
MGSLYEEDSELDNLVKHEEQRQETSLTLIASENYVFRGVYKYSASLLTNKYSEGRVGARYYGGTEWIDEVEKLCQKRALALFNLKDTEWGVCVQPYSGSPANLAAYSAMTVPGGKIMGMALPAGGHLTHGFQTKTKKVSASALFFEAHSYGVGDNGRINYKEIEEKFAAVQPDILICGYSAYSQDIEYGTLRRIVGDRAFLYGDVSHISGIISAGKMQSPFEHCDAVMTTTHKGLRGPRGALIFYRKAVRVRGVVHDLDAKINSAVFPLLQGGPHNHTIAGIAHALHMAGTAEYKEYIAQVLSNAQAMEKYFTERKYAILTGGTVNHMLILDLRSKGVEGAETETVCDMLGINVNKNTVPGDVSPLKPSGVRLGTFAITTRGLKEKEAEALASVVHYAVETVQRYRAVQGSVSAPSETVKAWVVSSGTDRTPEFQEKCRIVEEYARLFPIPRD